MNKNFILVFIILIITISSLFYFYNKNEVEKEALNEKVMVSIDQNIFIAEVVDNEKKRALGLSFRQSIEQNEAMLFVFDEPGNHGFWMKDMNFPIDIVWLGEDRVINHIEKNVSPDTYPTFFYSREPSLYVLEFKSGVTDKFDIKIGDLVEFELK